MKRLPNLLLFLLCGICFFMLVVRTENITLHYGDEIFLFDDTRAHAGIYMDSVIKIKKMPVVPDLIPWFEQWGPVSVNSKLRYCRYLHDCTPFITWEPQDTSLEAIAAGEYDDYITEYLEMLTKTCPHQEILIRFAHEMEIRPGYGLGWFAWQYDDGGTCYVKAWRHIITIGRSINPFIKWVWSPNRADIYSEGYYPGDEYVDYVGLTLNHFSDRSLQYDCFRDFYETEGKRKNLEKYGKKIILSEVAYAGSPDGENTEQKAAYLASIFDYVKSDDRIAAVAFFDENVNKNRQYMISDNKSYMDIYYEGVRSLGNEKEAE